MFGLTGIDTESAFILRTPSGYAAPPQVSIDGQPLPDVAREDDNTFTVTPAVPLAPNSVYVFRLTSASGREVSWAFQTSVRFEITSTLPRNESANVPVRTGIEVNFSFGEEVNISDYFKISPHVEGDFIYRDSTTIFTPKTPLAYSQIYTVTIQDGVKLPSFSETAGEVTFSFETAPAPDRKPYNPRWESRVHFSNRYVEFPSFEQPKVGFWLNFSNQRRRPAVTMTLYRFADRDEAINAVNKTANFPYWSHFSSEEFYIDPSKMEEISSEVVTERQGDPERMWGAETYTLPEALPQGFYLLMATTDDNPEEYRYGQVVIQVTDIATQIIADSDKALLWLNDMNTGSPIKASVYEPVSETTVESTEYGIAVLEHKLEAGNHLIVSAGALEGVVFIINGYFQSFWGGWGYYDDYEVSYDMPMARSIMPPIYNNISAHNTYWTALQLDRTLFQRSDTVSLWGFVQNRAADESISHVTAVLKETAWWMRPGATENDTLHTQNISVQNGAYSGELRLPNIDPGSYELLIYHGDIRLNSVYFTVMDYVKPPYQLTVSADTKAIFAGQEVTFTARTEFFEGTPVPDLDISYNSSGWGLSPNVNSREKTNLEGVVEITQRPVADRADIQGERSYSFSAEATLPEIGWTYEQASVRVFVNDIAVRPRATRIEKNATLTVEINDITLDRLNDGTSEHWSDYLSEPTANKKVNADIFEIYWERVQDGEFYDHITRQTVPRYRHERRENKLQSFEITTNADGVATRDFEIPNTERRTYEARLTVIDGNGRTIRHNVYIGRDYSSFYREAGNNRLYLYGAEREGYDIGDNVELTIMRGAEPLEQGNFLFVVVQNGILSYHIGKNTLDMVFGEEHVPNATVYAYHFNGHVYNSGGQMSQRLRYNPTNRELVISITTDKDVYRPGEIPSFIVKTTDTDGNPKAANVNISLVDEALFALMNYEVDTLAMLYGNVSDNLRLSMATHLTYVSDGIEDMDGMVAMSTDSAMGAPAPQMARNRLMAEVSMDMAEEESGGDRGGNTRIRERFEDTAIFASVRTDSSGSAVLSFPLPDNITSWRATASGISNDLYAGNIVQPVRVTMPMFLHHALNRTFLVGDTPTLGVNAYGTSLVGGEQVEFTVWREDEPLDIRRASGSAFERVNIPLWELNEEGSGAIIIRAVVAGFDDALKHEYQVVSSHRLIENAIFYEVSPQTVFDVNSGGLTNITFTDQGRGQFLSSLYSLRNTWWSGDRLEALVAKREATALIREHFPDSHIYGGGGSLDINNYQTQDGGIAILPYSSSELEVTVMLMPFVKDEVNVMALRRYLQTVYDTSATDNKMLALYGLAMLNEPVLLTLQDYAKLENLSLRNTAYLALAFAEIGEVQTARNLYTQRIAPSIQEIAPMYRVNDGTDNLKIVDATSVTALLAARLAMPEAIGLHNYATTNRVREAQPRDGNRHDHLLLNIERLLFISAEINNYADSQAAITYTLFGETVTRELRRGGSFTLRIPAQSIGEFKLTSVTGDVGAVSIVRKPLEEIDPVENDITITRRYLRGSESTTTFAQDELVRVEITVDYSATDLSGTYEITDFLPAGLVHVANSARFDNNRQGRHAFVTTEGQRVTFFDHNSGSRRDSERTRTYYYYARVINPGTFKAEGTVVQSKGAREYMVVGGDLVVTIE